MTPELEKIQRHFVSEFTTFSCLLALMIRSFGWLYGVGLYFAVVSIAMFGIWPLLLRYGKRKAQKEDKRWVLP